MRRSRALLSLFLFPLLLSSCTVGLRRASSENSDTSSKEDAASFNVSESSSSSPNSSLAKVSQETWVTQINNAGYVDLFGSMTLRATITLNGQEEIPYQEQIAEMDAGKLHLVTHSSSGSTEYYLMIDKEDDSYLLSSYSRYGGTWSRYQDSTPHDFAYILKNWLLLTPYTVFRYGDFSFNEEKECYISSTIYPGEASNYSLGNIRCYFTDNKASLLEMDMMAPAEGGTSLAKIGKITATIENVGGTKVELPILDGEQPEVEKSVGEEIVVSYNAGVNCRIALEANHTYLAYASEKSKVWTFDPSAAGTSVLEESKEHAYVIYQENEGEGHDAHFHLRSLNFYTYSFKVIDITGATKEDFEELGEREEGRCLVDVLTGIRFVKNGAILVSFDKHTSEERHLNVEMYCAFEDGAYRLFETCRHCGKTHMEVPFCYKACIGEKEYTLEEGKSGNNVVFTTTIDEVDSKQPIRFFLERSDNGEVVRQFDGDCKLVGKDDRRCNATTAHCVEGNSAYPVTMQKAKNASLELSFYNSEPQFFLEGYTDLPVAYLDTINGNNLVLLNSYGTGGRYPIYTVRGLSVKGGEPCRIGRWDEENKDFFEIPISPYGTDNNLVLGVSGQLVFHNDADNVSLTLNWDNTCFVGGYEECLGSEIVRIHFHNTDHTEGSYRPYV